MASDAERTIDPSQYKLTFSEEFDGPLDVSAWGPGTKWIAHTPFNGDFGNSRFADPQPGFPFATKDGQLRIEASKDKKGQWWSGLLASVDRKYNGFAQKFGYFEMRAKLPEGPGLWPAFWLIGINRKEKTYTAEIDVLEHYGHMPDRFSTGIIIYNRNNERGNHYKRNTRIPVPKGSLYSGFNTWGVA
ncbi:MAG: glycoside hydrolase family 16 protein, partial [Pseudomonadota bacterium]